MGSTIMFSFTPVKMWKFLGPLVIVVHQGLLLTTSYRNFVLFGWKGDAARDGGFLEANREGIIASVGFLAIYLIGVQLGTLLMKKR
jgi:phosphatidylinositol glycan class W